LCIWFKDVSVLSFKKVIVLVAKMLESILCPTSGGYEKGHEDSGFPFDTFSDSDSDYEL
jgi:hypothetical protein